MKRVFYILYSASIICSIFLFTACDEHEAIDTGKNIHVGYVLCDDHRIMSVEQYEMQSAVKAVGVVFAGQTDQHPPLAVMIDQVGFTHSDKFAEKLGIKQDTSCSLDTFDGFLNTVAMQSGTYSEKESYWTDEDGSTYSDTFTYALSPMAQQAFRSHEFGQSDYIPSVAEMRLLVASLPTVNPIIERLGGQVISTDSDGGNCWYWTSTEVKENPSNMAWLMSSVNGGIQQTPKDEIHLFRLILALNY